MKRRRGVFADLLSAEFIAEMAGTKVSVTKKYLYRYLKLLDTTPNELTPQQILVFTIWAHDKLLKSSTDISIPSLSDRDVGKYVGVQPTKGRKQPQKRSR